MNQRRLLTQSLRLSITVSLAVLGVLTVGCAAAQPTYTPTPTKTSTPMQQSTEIVAPVAPTATILTPASPTVLLLITSTQENLANAVVLATEVPAQLAQPTVASPEASSVLTPQPVFTSDVAPATPEPPPVPTPATARAPLPPQQGGSWDMEEGFYVWPSPYVEFGGFVANGWASFLTAYDPTSNPSSAPRLNENKNPRNVYSGQRSQEISFDYRSGEAGIYRTVDVIPTHRYRIAAWAKYTPSPSGLDLYLGVDQEGGTNFEAATVTWYPWQEMAPDRWVSTTETVQATGPRLSIFVRAVHPVAEAGGNTMFDDIRLTDLGP